MRVLILSCSTGQGHNSAARAIEDALIKKGAECLIIDPLSFSGRRTAKKAADIYTAMMKNAPNAFGVIYKVGEIYSSTGIISPVYQFNARYSKKLEAYINEEKFDAVISTHLYGMEACTAIRKRGKCKVPFFGVLTDYTCIPFFAETHLDAYFIPQEELKDELVSCGMEADRLISSGIPVNPRFSCPTEKSEARKKLGLKENTPAVLVMNGGIGCENILDFCKEFINGNETDFSLLVLTGRNAKLKRRAEESFGNDSRVKIIPYTEEVYLYMFASDVVISKPGGLTSTEAAVAGIPLIHLLAYAGCETKNAEFFSKRGMSKNAANVKEAAEFTKNTVYSKEEREWIVQMQRKYIPQNAAETIVQKVLEYGKK